MFDIPYYKLPLDTQLSLLTDRYSGEVLNEITTIVEGLQDVTIVTVNDNALTVTYNNGMLCKVFILQTLSD